MFAAKINRATALIQEALSDFEPALLTADSAAEAVRILAKTERMVVAAKTLSARRVEETNLHKRHGHKDAATWLANETGEAPSESAGMLAAARQMESLPDVAEAFKAGDLSPAKSPTGGRSRRRRPIEATDTSPRRRAPDPGRVALNL